MNKNFSSLSVFIIALTASLGALFIDRNFFRDGWAVYKNQHENLQEIFDRYRSDSSVAFSANINFVKPALEVKKMVVHIRTVSKSIPDPINRYHQNLPDFEDFYEDFGPMNESSGSGVILSPDGYIVTNNHVIKGGSQIDVILDNKQSFKAQLIGSDPTTDLALLKIQAQNLPFIKLGNSDAVSIGEWALAIGNPFELTSTVTAGIISGKARSINILRGKSNLAIESFIQTDAAVNPGNSGGALVNLKGELIGINTAIASTTGAYSGYSFAIPSNLVKKIIEDLQKFGEVQRGLLGVTIRDIDASLAFEEGLSNLEGVFVGGVGPGSAAEQAGIKKGDVILEVEKKKVESVSELQENIGRFRPGNKVQLKVRRGKEEQLFQVTLKNQHGELASKNPNPSNSIVIWPEMQASLKKATSESSPNKNLSKGVEILDPGNGPLALIGVTKGFKLFKLDKEPVSSPEDVIRIYRKAKGAILIEGVEPSGKTRYFALPK